MHLVYLARSGTAWDITGAMDSVVWSGDYQQAARKLEVTLAWSDTDPDYPRDVIGGIDNGEMFFLYSDAGDELFQGYIFSVGKTLGSLDRKYTVYDGLIYLLKSSIAHNFQKITAQGVTRQVGAELGIPLGTMPDDAGVAISFAHIARPAYEAIMGAWTQVKKASGMEYLPVMKGGSLGVVVMGDTVADRILTPSTDLATGDVTSSIEGAITKVLVVDKNGKTLSTAEDPETRKLYGLLQAAVEKETGLDAKAQAKDTLKGADDQISLSDIIGGPDALDMVTGNAVLVEEPSTGLHGKFQIINDTHTFSDGLHKVALGLSFEGMMDEVDLDLIVAKKKSSTHKSSGTTPPVVNPWKRWEDYGTSGTVKEAPQ
jgi:hypothetical protein